MFERVIGKMTGLRLWCLNIMSPIGVLVCGAVWGRFKRYSVVGGSVSLEESFETLLS